MRPDRLIRRSRGAQFVLLGKRQRVDRVQPPDGAVGRVAGAFELAAIEARALEQVFDLLPVERRVEARLLRPRRGFDLGLDHRHQAAPPWAPEWSIASSPFAAR